MFVLKQLYKKKALIVKKKTSSINWWMEDAFFVKRWALVNFACCHQLEQPVPESICNLHNTPANICLQLSLGQTPNETLKMDTAIYKILILYNTHVKSNARASQFLARVLNEKKRRPICLPWVRCAEGVVYCWFRSHLPVGNRFNQKDCFKNVFRKIRWRTLFDVKILYKVVWFDQNWASKFAVCQLLLLRQQAMLTSMQYFRFVKSSEIHMIHVRVPAAEVSSYTLRGT